MLGPECQLMTSLYRKALVCRSEGIQTLQNRIVRLITFSNWNRRSSTSLGDLSWGCLERGHSKQQAIFEALGNPSSTSLNGIFTGKSSSSVHSQTEKFKINLFVARPNTEARKRSFEYHGSVLWNSLRWSIKMQPTLNSLNPLHNPDWTYDRYNGG